VRIGVTTDQAADFQTIDKPCDHAFISSKRELSGRDTPTEY